MDYYEESTTFKSLALLTGLSCAFGAIVYNFVSNGIYYNITGTNTVEATYGSNKYTDQVNIPTTVTYSGTTYQVKAIGVRAFEYCSDLTGVTIPTSVTSMLTARLT